MKLKYIKAFAACIMGLAATACSDSDDWTPGPDTNPDSMGVYFEAMSSYSLTIGPDDSRIIPITVGRAKYDEAATVALDIIEMPEGAVVPPTIDFEAGEQTKTIYVDLENMPSKSSGNLVINLPEEVSSPYSAGTSFISMQISVAGAWIPYGQNATVCFYDLSWNEKYPSITSEIYNLEETKQLKLPNFLNSGLDIVLEVGELYEAYAQYELTVLRNFIDVKDYYGSDYGYEGWLLYDQANEMLPEFSPDGTQPYIVSMEFDPTIPNYQFMRLDGEDSYIKLFAYVAWADGAANYYTVYVYFTPEFDLFESTTTE